jgi:hypothetical protein
LLPKSNNNLSITDGSAGAKVSGGTLRRSASAASAHGASPVPHSRSAGRGVRILVQHEGAATKWMNAPREWASGRGLQHEGQPPNVGEQSTCWPAARGTTTHDGHTPPCRSRAPSPPARCSAAQRSGSAQEAAARAHPECGARCCAASCAGAAAAVRSIAHCSRRCLPADTQDTTRTYPEAHSNGNKHMQHNTRTHWPLSRFLLMSLYYYACRCTHFFLAAPPRHQPAAACHDTPGPGITHGGITPRPTPPRAPTR